MDLILDVNIQIYPVDLGKKKTFFLSLCVFVVLFWFVLNWKSFVS